jgi:hypothetical protein
MPRANSRKKTGQEKLSHSLARPPALIAARRAKLLRKFF